MKPHKYCTFCGEKLDIKWIPANKASYLVYAGNGEAQSQQVGTEYSEKTGMPQYVMQYKCPNKKWYNWQHNCFVDEESLRDGSFVPETKWDNNSNKYMETGKKRNCRPQF